MRHGHGIMTWPEGSRSGVWVVGSFNSGAVSIVMGAPSKWSSFTLIIAGDGSHFVGVEVGFSAKPPFLSSMYISSRIPLRRHGWFFFKLQTSLISRKTGIPFHRPNDEKQTACIPFFEINIHTRIAPLNNGGWKIFGSLSLSKDQWDWHMAAYI